MLLPLKKVVELNLMKQELFLTHLKLVWPDGQMTVRSDKEITDETPYGGGQITEINEEESTVTFVAHRGWGPDGQNYLLYCN